MISPFLRMRGFLKFAVLTVVFLITAQCASAQTNLVFDTSGNIVGNYVGARSIVADWVASAGASGGAGLASSGTAVVGTAAGDLSVATTLNAAYSAARVAGIAAKVARAGTVVGAAFTAWQVYDMVKQSGISICPAPDFFCVPDPSKPLYDPAQMGWTSSYAPCRGADAGFPAEDSCTVASAAESVRAANGSNWVLVSTVSVSPTDVRVTIHFPGCCDSGADLRLPSRFPPNPNPNGMLPAADSDIAASVAAKEAADSTYGPKVLAAARGDVVHFSGAVYPNVVAPSDLPISVSAAPVTGPSTVTSTSTAPNADGSTSTTTTSKQSTVTPRPTGTTVSDTNIKYDVSTITTSTTVNNVTNVTTITTTTDNQPANSPASGPTVPFPTDYNREVTQQKILSGSDAGALPPDQKVLVKTATDAADAQLAPKFTDLTSQQTTDKSSWFSWVWTPPVGSCSPYTGTVHGFAIAWDICPWVNNIRDALGWLFALFGCWNIYGLIFQRGA